MKNHFFSFMSSNKYKLYSLYVILLLLLSFLLLFSVFRSTLNDENAWRDQSTLYEASHVELTAGGQTSTVQLPYTGKTNYGREPYSISFQLRPEASDVMLLHTIYTPAQVYVDDDLIYSFGEKGSYPGFMVDPPCNAVEISLPDIPPGEVTVRIDYQAPFARDHIVINPPRFGTEASVIHYLLFTYGTSFFIATFFIVLGLLLIAITFLFTSYEDKSKIFLWSGLLVLPAGLWELFENNFTVFLFESPSINYIVSFMALFSLTIPFYRFSMLIMKLDDSLLLQVIHQLLNLILITMLFLQLTGTVQFSQSMYFFHVLLPLSLWILNGRILYEVLHNPSSNGIHYLIAVTVLSFSTLLELINYYYRFTKNLSSLFQLGLLIYIALSGFFAADYIRSSFQVKEENLLLQERLHYLTQSINTQKERNMLLMQHQDEIRKQRHDLRHQLIAMKDLLTDEKFNELSEYMSSLINAIPEGQNTAYCENNVVNAIIQYYVAIAEHNHIEIYIRAVFPPACLGITDSYLCVLVGNLLENGIEACKRIEYGRRFIRFNSRIQGDMLFITMDNSYNGTIKRDEQGYFISSKREERGTGLASVKSIAEQHGGSARFEVKDGVFQSNVYILI